MNAKAKILVGDLDARIAAAFQDGVPSAQIHALLGEVQSVAGAASEAAEAARLKALDPLTPDVAAARRATDDATFKRDRLLEAYKRLTERLQQAKAEEERHRRQAVYDAAKAAREGILAELEVEAPAVVRLAQLVARSVICDRALEQANRTLPVGAEYLRPTMQAAGPLFSTLFDDAIVADGFVAVARLYYPEAVKPK
jgi:hypothetical protein